MLRILFIEIYKSTKTILLSTYYGKNDFNNCQIKNLVNGHSANGGEILTEQ